MNFTSGLHHITAIASDPQKNVHFYAGILGLRLVKKTINFDDPDVYHLYYGNERGTPGTILTFFPYVGIPQGRKGKGQLTTTSFSILPKALDYWRKRLDKFQIPYHSLRQRFPEEEVISFQDWDGLSLELVANSKEDRPGFTYGHVPVEFSIRGFYGITLTEECTEKTAQLLTSELGYELLEEKENLSRFSQPSGKGGFVDIRCQPDALRGLGGAGTIHHVAFATATEQTQHQARVALVQRGYNVTPVLDREYFHSIYFREPGGVLFEIATLPPGFTVDEALAHLGESLKLPPWEEKNRTLIERRLPALHFNPNTFVD